MPHYQPINLRDDNDLMNTIWLNDRKAVITRLMHMYHNGWQVRRHGLSSIDENGNTIIARPIRTKEGANGIAIWKISDHDQEVF